MNIRKTFFFINILFTISKKQLGGRPKKAKEIATQLKV
jgi:hypothetical protein